MTPAAPPPPWLRLLAAPFGLRPVQLRDPTGRDEAARLLYEVFFEEQGWDPFTPNASELRADHETRRFRDRFDTHAVWLGLRDAEGALGATRTIGTTSPEVARGSARRMGWRPTGHVLRYHPQDPGSTHLLSYDLSPRYQLEVLLNVLTRRLRRSLRGAP